ncbi:MAG: glyoxalase [Actinobacteria bacterium]|nr:glyoxalase [Actinomycetota bacterium]
MIDRHDPLSVLHGDDLPVQPDPQFAARLKSRLESALSLPNRTGDVTMSGTDTAISELKATGSPRPAAPAQLPRPAAPAQLPRPAAVPYLTVARARDAIAWYVDAFGATVDGEPIVMGDGRIGHAELTLAGGVLYLADEFPEAGLTAPAAGATSVSLMLPVADTDATLERARAYGARVERDVYEDHGTRNATLYDPFGHRWMLSGPVTGEATPIRHGDVGYVSLSTPDAARAAVFYGHVLGWTVDPVTHRVTNTDQPIDIVGAADRSTLFCCYAVTDLDGARQAILTGGGRPGAVREFEFGTVLDATDPQGTAFAVYTPAGPRPRPELNGTGPGELSYITYEVADTAAFRAFYRHVLYWTFEPGRVQDGWQIVGSHPMAGAAGGSDRPTTTPMWTVADLDGAVARVVEAGGTVLDGPSLQSYGSMAECTDDQGGRFYLGQF